MPPGMHDMTSEPGHAPGTSPEREVFTSRHLAAPPEAVWAAWVDPARLARWWGPKGFCSTFHEFDPRPAGRWRFTMHGPDGTDYPNESVFVEVAPAARLVFDHVSGHAFRFTATFAAEGAGTRLGWRMTFATAAEAAAVATVVTGANEQNLDRLEAELREDTLRAPAPAEGHDMPAPVDQQPRWMTWTGRVLTALPALAMAMSAGMKLSGQPEVVEVFVGHFGFPAGTLSPIGLVELLCAVSCCVPRSAMLGAVLATGYLGGAIVTHVRVGESFALPLLLGVLVWGGLFLRDRRLRALLPWRQPAA
jgi:uncharacterized protein YndB with AHSA1/START domain